jgi:hypothetical protein
MILTVNYNKTSGAITLSSDISSIAAEINDNATDDNSGNLSFEISLDTSTYEQINELPSE